MNYRLPNPSGKKWRDNYDRTFPRCADCGSSVEVTPWRLEHDRDGQIRHLVCRSCRSIEVERDADVSESADIHDMQAEEESQMEEDIRLDNAQRFRDLRR